MSATEVSRIHPGGDARAGSADLGSSATDRGSFAPTLDQKLAAEFMGTFVLVFTVGMATSKSGAGILAPLAIGSALMVMVFAGAHVSGAHYNPAVSISIMLRGKVGRDQTVAYLGTQLLAGALAGLLVRGLAGPAHPPALAAGWKIFALEFLFTFVLAYVVLNVATARATDGNSFFGIAIGFTLATGVFAVGNLSGGVFNPAVALGGSLDGSLLWGHFWIYLLADFLGGAIAAPVFEYLHRDRRDSNWLPAARDRT